MKEELAAYAQQAQQRGMTYAFLARALSDEEIPVSFLASLRGVELGSGTELDDFARGLADADLEHQRAELAADHASALLGMSADPVSPYESVHTSDTHLMMQEARDEVVAAYRAQGFAASDALRTPEDHISLELSFMAALCEQLADALASSETPVDENTQVEPEPLGCPAAGKPQAGPQPQGEGDLEHQVQVETGDTEAAAGEPAGIELPARAAEIVEAQARFVHEHLARWVPGFCDELEAHAATPFYRGAAQMLRGFLADEATYL